MAKAWKDVIASPQYQALAPEQKAQAQEQYFNEVVAPQAGENAEQAKQAFYAAYPLPSVQPVDTQQPVAQQQPQQSGFMSDLGEAVKETGRGLVQAGVNVANIPASVADAVTSAAAWAGGKLGIGDGTYQPAPRVTTQGLEQDFGLQQGALTPQTTEGRVFAEALPYLTPAGVERAAAQAPTLAGRIAQGATRLLAENAVGSLAANSAKDDAEALATDLGVGVLTGGAINAALRKYQQANAVYADEAAKLKNTRLKNVLMKGDLTPEVVNNMLFSKNKSEIKTLYNSVGRVGRAQMRNGIIGKAMEKSGGSPDQFLRQLNILQNQTGITFKGQDAAYLKGLKNYLQSTQQAAKAAVTTPTGQQTIPFIIGYGTAMNPATTGAAVSYGLLTRAYESEPFRNAMLRMANTPRGSTAFEKAMQQAQKAINAMTQGAKSDALSE
ncbi:TPA: hypothetical protein N6086_000798 [Escherichia coli]|nr:hypothetical protein [Escherichia coli]HCN8405533.1 hypothetical protein [Escherichia coli]